MMTEYPSEYKQKDTDDDGTSMWGDQTPQQDANQHL